MTSTSARDATFAAGRSCHPPGGTKPRVPPPRRQWGLRRGGAGRGGEDHNDFGGSWHTDLSYLERPALASLLNAKEIPPVGGDTLFANTYLAYEALSDGLKRALDGLDAVHDTRMIHTPGAQASPSSPRW